MPRAFFAAFGLVPLGTGCYLESPTPHSPPHQLSKFGQAETVNGKETEDIGGGGDLSQPSLPNRSGCTRDIVQRPTPASYSASQKL